MKKVVSIVLSVCLLLPLCGCFQKASAPDKVVQAFCTAIPSYDIDKMDSCTSFDKSMLEYISLSFGEGEDSMVDYFLDYLKEWSKKTTYSLKEIDMQEDAASIQVRFQYVDASSPVETALVEYAFQTVAQVLAGATEDQLRSILKDFLAEKLAAQPSGLSEETVTFACRKENGVWKIAGISSAEILRVLTCNLSDSFSPDR